MERSSETQRLQRYRANACAENQHGALERARCKTGVFTKENIVNTVLHGQGPVAGNLENTLNPRHINALPVQEQIFDSPRLE